MRVVDKVKERMEILEETRRKQAEEREAKSPKLEPTEFYITESAWQTFLSALMGGGIRDTYPNDLPGVAFYLDKQIEVANKFMELSVRDRKSIEDLLVDEYKEDYRNVPIALPSDPKVVNKLKTEAIMHGLNYITYLRAIFYSRAVEIKNEKDKRNTEYQKQMLDKMSEKVEGIIDCDLIAKLEKKYGKPQCDLNLNFFGKQFDYFDMLVKAANAYLDKK